MYCCVLLHEASCAIYEYSRRDAGFWENKKETAARLQRQQQQQ